MGLPAMRLPLASRPLVATALLASSTACTLAWLLLRTTLDGDVRLAITVVALALHALTCAASPALPRRAVPLAAAVVLTVAITSNPWGSSDVWSYAAYGHLLVDQHASPYAHTPSELLDGPLRQHVAVAWRGTSSVYGPAFNAIAAGGAALAGPSLLADRLFHQALAGASLLAVVAMCAPGRRRFAMVALLLNPAALAIVNGGHNDLLTGALVAWGALLLGKGRPRAAGALMAIALCTKATALVPALALCAWCLVERRRARAAALRFTTTMVTVTIAAYVLAGGARAVAPLAHNGSYRSRASIWSGPTAVLDLPAPLVALAAGATTVALVALVVARSRRNGRTNDGAPPGPVASAARVAGRSSIASTLCLPYALPWYAGASIGPALLADPATALLSLLQVDALAIAYATPPGSSLRGTVERAVAAIAVPSAFLITAGLLLRERSRSTAAEDGGAGADLRALS